MPEQNTEEFSAATTPASTKGLRRTDTQESILGGPGSGMLLFPSNSTESLEDYHGFGKEDKVTGLVEPVKGWHPAPDRSVQVQKAAEPGLLRRMEQHVLPCTPSPLPGEFRGRALCTTPCHAWSHTSRAAVNRWTQKRSM